MHGRKTRTLRRLNGVLVSLRIILSRNAQIFRKRRQRMNVYQWTYRIFECKKDRNEKKRIFVMMHVSIAICQDVGSVIVLNWKLETGDLAGTIKSLYFRPIIRVYLKSAARNSYGHTHKDNLHVIHKDYSHEIHKTNSHRIQKDYSHGIHKDYSHRIHKHYSQLIHKDHSHRTHKDYSHCIYKDYSHSIHKVYSHSIHEDYYHRSHKDYCMLLTRTSTPFGREQCNTKVPRGRSAISTETSHCCCRLPCR